MTTIYYIYIKKDKKKGPRPVEAIANSLKDKNDIVQFLLDKKFEVEVKERQTESYDDYLKRIEQNTERNSLIESAKSKLSKAELDAIISSTKE